MLKWIENWKWSHTLALGATVLGMVQTAAKVLPLPPAIGIAAAALGSLLGLFLPTPVGSSGPSVVKGQA